MENLESEYPTEQQIEEMWAALETGEDKAILAVLQKREIERREVRAEETEDSPEHRASKPVEAAISIPMRRRPWKS